MEKHVYAVFLSDLVLFIKMSLIRIYLNQ